MKQNELILKIEDYFNFNIIITKDKKNNYNVKIIETPINCITTSSFMRLNLFVTINKIEEDINIIKIIILDYLNRNRFKDIKYSELCDIIAKEINELQLFGFSKEASTDVSNIKLIYNDKYIHHTRKYYYGNIEYDKKEVIKNVYKK